jgi:hypothetical protein
MRLAVLIRAVRARRQRRLGLVLRGLGLVYLVAFTSLRSQVRGLYGRRGIVPVRDTLDTVGQMLQSSPEMRRARLGRFRAVPSLLWLDSSDAGLVRLATAGQAAGLAMALGVLPRLAAAVAWAAYLSFVSVGRVFLRFQWDTLLLEAGLHALFGRSRRWLMRSLAIRLQVESGVAKWASHDPCWRDLSACAHHQETQPLPTPLGWYAHHLPRRLHRLASALTLGIECGAPALLLGPRPARVAGVAVLTGFQSVIAATGNYAFFNLLTALLNQSALEPRPPRPRGLLRWIGAGLEAALGGALLVLGAADLAARLRPRLRRSELLDRASAAIAPLHAVGSYGLFSVMTTSRPEIVVEGSDDGQHWRAYGFRYKPGDVSRRPRWVAPHQPRLDWQMWFAALGPPPTWFAVFLARLLQGAPEVRALLGEDPFPAAPPRFVRARLYDYTATDLETRRRTGAWWARREVGTYFPTCALVDGSLRFVRARSAARSSATRSPRAP